jgi:hypothetical protein
LIFFDGFTLPGLHPTLMKIYMLNTGDTPLLDVHTPQLGPITMCLAANREAHARCAVAAVASLAAKRFGSSKLLRPVPKDVVVLLAKYVFGTAIKHEWQT